MPDPLGVYTDISAREYLEFFARVLEIPRNEIDSRISETVEMLGLAPWLSEEVETLSAGWQRRLALGRILLADLPVLLLDEPAAGLDITARTELLAIVRRLAGTRRSVIVSSHILPELEELADRFGIISKGAWVEIAPGQTFFTRSELMAGLGASVWRIRCNNNRKAASILLDLNFEGVETRQDILSFKGESDDDGAAALKAIVKENVDVFEFRREEMQLTNLVLDVLGRKEGAAE
jgi:ABC-2 type transport system ATP-binding protein